MAKQGNNKKSNQSNVNNLFSMLTQLVDSKGLEQSRELANFLAFPAPYTKERKDSEFAKMALKNVIRLVDDAEIGLKLAKFISPNVFNGLGYLFMTAADVKTGFEEIAQLPSLYHDVVNIDSVKTAAGLEVRIRNDYDDPYVNSVVDEGTVAILANYLQWVFNDEPLEIDIAFSHEALNSEATYQSHLNTQPSFNQPTTILYMSEQQSNLPLHSADEDYHQMLWQKLKAIQDKSSSRFSDQIKAAIRERLPNGTHTKQILADRFSVSEKTIDRRLAEENTNYREIVTQVRKELATIYLTNPSNSLDKIAQLLGYNDRSAFSKAYKNWTGKSPRS